MPSRPHSPRGTLLASATGFGVVLLEVSVVNVALEALREAWSAKRMTSDQIWHYAKIDRVANVMRAYLESLA